MQSYIGLYVSVQMYIDRWLMSMNTRSILYIGAYIGTSDAGVAAGQD